MKLETIKLFPFAGVNQLELTFQPGMNTILGKNEAGKSSIFHALHSLLLQPTKINKRTFNGEIKKFIPLGGDIARAQLNYHSKDARYCLYKAWSESQMEYSLEDSEGVRIEQEKHIDEKIEACLPAGKAVCQNILFGFQSSLAKTISNLLNSREEYRNLGKILRASFSASDGISPEKFMDELQQELDLYLQNWDVANEQPKNHRNIYNPYKKGLGKVLSAYYKKEQSQIDYQAALQIEKQYGQIQSQLSALDKELHQVESYIITHKETYSDLKQKESLDLKYKSLSYEYTDLKQQYDHWTTGEVEFNQLTQELPTIQNKIIEKQKQQKEAKIREQQAHLQKKYETCQQLSLEYQQKVDHLKKMQNLPGGLAEKITELQTEIRELDAYFSAGQIRLRIVSHRDQQFTLQEGEKLKTIQVSKGRKFTGTYPGEFFLQTENYDIEVALAREDFSVKQQIYEQKKQELDNIYQQYEVDNAEKVYQIVHEYEKAQAEIKQSYQYLQQQLDGQSLEELQKQLNQQQQNLTTVSFHEISDRLYALQAEYKTVQEKQKQLHDKLTALKDKYQDRETFMELLLTKKNELQNLLSTLDTFGQLPTTEKDLPSFLKNYEQQEKRYNQIITEKHQKELEARDIQVNMPENSSEELQVLQEEAQQEFRQYLNKAEMLLEIQEKAQKIVQNETMIYTGYLQKLQKTIQSIQTGKYKNIMAEDNYPVGLIRKDGTEIPYLYLSKGTVDIFALAIRLTMAEYFLQEKQGFLILDDPLVEMDPGRQKKAVRLIEEYAQNFQIIFFTCHPSVAKLFAEPPIKI